MWDIGGTEVRLEEAGENRVKGWFFDILGWRSCFVYDLIITIFCHQVHRVIMHLSRSCSGEAFVSEADVVASIYCKVYEYLSI